jgi:hypothetical protein
MKNGPGSLLVYVAVAGAAALTASANNAENIEFFETHVRPLLERNCIECHGEAKQKGGLRLDSQPAWKKGGESGQVIVEGDPDRSLLITAIRYRDKDLRMPPDDELPAREKAVLEEWVRRGAPDPRSGQSGASYAKSNDGWETEFKKRLDWWSLQPLARGAPPAVSDSRWSREPVDRFILTSLAEKGLKPSPPAAPETLLRRASFVVTGLPPAPDLREAFLTKWAVDPEKAYTTLVDSLLGSPHFGEHFARHWMDVVRYTDTYGYEWDTDVKGAWEYRDYLIRAFNKDVSYSQLLTEQLAGDLLEKPRIDLESGVNESLVGPLFYHMGLHQAGDSLLLNIVHQEMIDNKINVLSKAFVATTVACARCHDHKLEAVSQKDYYALAAVLMTPRWTTRVIDAPGARDREIDRLKTLRGSIRNEMAARWKESVDSNPNWQPKKLREVVARRSTKDATVDDIGYVITLLAEHEDWRVLLGPGDGSAGVPELWRAIEAQWREEREKRRHANEIFTTVGNIAKGELPAGWVPEGDGIEHGFVSDGTPRVALTGKAVIAGLLPAGYHTHALSSKLPGALRLPPQTSIPGKFLSLKVAGKRFSGFRKVAANAFLADPLQFFDQAAPEWLAVADIPLTPQVEKVALEFETASLNPYFPPRTGISVGLPNPDLGYDRRSWFSITGIVSHEKEGVPKGLLGHLEPLFERTPTSLEAAWQAVRDWLAGAVVRWSEGRHSAGDTQIVNWLIEQGLLPNVAEPGSRAANLVAEYRKVEESIPSARAVVSMDERETARMSYRLNIRGNADMAGEPVEPAFLSMLAGTNSVDRSPGSGRLELARSLVDPEHPMTSRVYVNRVWQWVFGTGIVDTPSDFGRLGGKPSHPELLDWLARSFTEDGWSTKRLLRRLLLSQTFRQSGEVDPLANERDPSNRLLHHYPTRRLGAESIRDSLLAVSGELDRRLYGKPIEVPRALVDSQKRLYSGSLEGNGRRSLYLKISMADPPKFLVAFNQPDPGMSAGSRDVTNVPAQALTLLNDPFVNQVARRWASRLVSTLATSSEDRIRSMFVSGYGRLPSDRELRRWTEAVRSFAPKDGGDLLRDEDAWASLAHAFFNTKEFIFYR